MAKVLVNESSLTGIADAIRGKNGSTDTYKPSEMAAAITAISGGGEPIIEALEATSNGTYTAPDGVDGYSPVTVNVPQDGGPPESAFVISGDCSYRFSYNGWNWFIENYGNRITTNNINNASYMFYRSGNIETIPFEINCDTTNYITARVMFGNCEQLTIAPKINNLMFNSISGLFLDCHKLKTIPNDFCDSWTYELSDSFSQDRIFYNCYSLRSTPTNIFECGNSNIRYSNSCLYFSFYCCYNLDELINLPIPYGTTWKYNCLEYTFFHCERLKNITFAKQDDGTPYTVNWNKQVLNLTYYVGYVGDNIDNIILWNSGITDDKAVTDDASYQALKNDPDWFALDIAYSRYNHDSAVATINSLPDTSAYLATAGGTNTIKFEGAAGSATDGGAINTLTEEEIAVATAKGWTVTLV